MRTLGHSAVGGFGGTATSSLSSGGGDVSGGSINPVALRTFITANYNQPNPHNQSVMASPPTVTALSGAQGDIVTTYSHTDPVIFHSGGKVFTANGSRQYPCATLGTSGGNISGTGLNGVRWRATTSADASKVWISVSGSGTVPYRFIIGTQYVDLTGTLSNNTSTPRYFLLDFGSKAVRTITVEGEQNLGFQGFAVGAGDSCSAPTMNTKRLLMLGDSFTTGTAATRLGDGFATIVAEQLGFADIWASGMGGTGYVATNSGTRYSLPQRVVTDTDAFTALGSADIVAVAMGLNDFGLAGIQAAAEGVLANIRNRAPTSQIFVLGPWDVNAPGAPAANYATTKSAIQAAITARGGVSASIRFIDMQGVSFTQSGGHPDTAGHKTLGDYIALQIKTALGA